MIFGDLFNDVFLAQKVLACCLYVFQIYTPFNMATIGTSKHFRKCLV